MDGTFERVSECQFFDFGIRDDLAAGIDCDRRRIDCRLERTGRRCFGDCVVTLIEAHEPVSAVGIRTHRDNIRAVVKMDFDPG